MKVRRIILMVEVPAGTVTKDELVATLDTRLTGLPHTIEASYEISPNRHIGAVTQWPTSS